MPKENSKLDKAIKERLGAIEDADAFFITITTRKGDRLKHYQRHSRDFFYGDLIPSLKEMEKLIYEAYPGFKYIRKASTLKIQNRS